MVLVRHLVLNLIFGLLEDLLVDKSQVHVRKDGWLHIVIQKLKVAPRGLLHGLQTPRTILLPTKAAVNGVIALLEVLIVFGLLAVLLRLLNIVVAKGGLTRFTTTILAILTIVTTFVSRGILGLENAVFGV